MNSKKTNNEPAADEDVLQRHAQYAETLTATGSAIPALLREEADLRAELGEGEISGGDTRQLRERLDTITNAMASASRQRATACAGLLSMASELRAARAEAAEELAGIAHDVVADFQERWNDCCAQLGALHAEAAALSRILRVTVPAKPPYTSALSSDGCRMQVTYSGHIQADAVTLAPEMAVITGRLDALDAAGAMCAAVGQAQELSRRYHALEQERGTGVPMGGTYTVVRGFDFLGVRYATGMLVNADILSPGLLHRYYVAKQLMPVAAAAARAA